MTRGESEQGKKADDTFSVALSGKIRLVRKRLQPLAEYGYGNGTERGFAQC